MKSPIATGHDQQIVPQLRDDLLLETGPVGSDGAPTWLIVDSLRHQYFQVTKTAFALMSYWGLGDPDAIRRAAAKRLGQPVDAEDVTAVVEFVKSNELTIAEEHEGWRSYSERSVRQTKGVLSQTIHSYIFMRIPLFRPQRFLDAAWPWVGWIFSLPFVVAMVVGAMGGLWLVGRQWDVFAATLASFLSFEALAAYGASLVVVKLVHELGHAFMARKYDVCVPTIGVALIVLFPILYTDTSAAWRVGRRERLMIDCAGMFAEMCLAVIATLLWVFLPDGALRSIMFVVATTSWTVSILVNFNPLMRFDGYYILSDFVGVSNLQQRSFALGRWGLREALFGFGDPRPEQLPKNMERWLICLAWATWIYRFFLFLGIALLVYHFFIKAVGIALFIIEIVWFIGGPIWRELREWSARYTDLCWNRQSIRSCIGLSVLAVLFLSRCRGRKLCLPF